MKQTLFGVAVPEGAVRVVIRPVLGRGPAQPLFEGPLSTDSVPTDTDVTVAASRNGPFWEYIDAQVKAKRIEAAADGWQWKLRISFHNQLKVEDSFTTDDAFEFYRSGAAGKGEESGLEPKLVALIERGTALLQELGRHQAKALRKQHKANTKALAKIASACTTAVKEVNTAAASAIGEVSKQAGVVADVAKALQQETIELKEGIFELQTELRQAPKQAPKSTAEQLKDVVDTVNTFKGFVDGMSGTDSSRKQPGPEPAPGPSGAKE